MIDLHNLILTVACDIIYLDLEVRIDTYYIIPGLFALAAVVINLAWNIVRWT